MIALLMFLLVEAVIGWTPFDMLEIPNSYNIRGGQQRLLSVDEVTNMDPVMRKLVGSNCVLIERGNVPPYYDCLGCIIDEAQGCVDDLRHNTYGNVHPDCNSSTITEVGNNARQFERLS